MECEKWASPSYPFLCQQFAGLLQVLRRLVPDVRMVAEHQQALLIGKHHCNHKEQQRLRQSFSTGGSRRWSRLIESWLCGRTTPSNDEGKLHFGLNPADPLLVTPCW